MTSSSTPFDGAEEDIAAVREFESRHSDLVWTLKGKIDQITDLLPGLDGEPVVDDVIKDLGFAEMTRDEVKQELMDLLDQARRAIEQG